MLNRITSGGPRIDTKLEIIARGHVACLFPCERCVRCVWEWPGVLLGVAWLPCATGMV